MTTSQATASASPELSVVIPIYNEEETLPELARRVTSSLGQAGFYFEVIFVNDGSRDESPSILRRLASGDQRIKVVMQDGMEIRDLYQAAATNNVQIRKLNYKRDSLEDIFLKAMENGQ